MTTKEPTGTELSRRSFLKGAAAVGGGLAAAGLLSACNKVVPMEAVGLPEKWDYETDVVVVGYGGAGAAAAWEALTAGSKTMILERASVAGGSTNICGGFVTIGGGTPLQKALGFEDSPDNYYNYLVAAAGPGASEEHCRVLADNALDLYDWLVDTLGVKFNESYNPIWPEPDVPDAGLTCSGDEYSSDYEGIAAPAPRGHWVEGFGVPEGALTGNRNGSGFFKPLQDSVEALGAEVLYDTPATRLVVDSATDRVVGVVAEEMGKEVFVRASQGVILSAGGFAKNEEMVQQYCPYIAGGFVIGTDGDDGAGIRMGQGVGGDVRHMNFAYGNLTTASWMHRHSGPGGPLCTGIMVNQRGMRFIAEDHYYAYAPGMMRNPYYFKDFQPAYAIFDQESMDMIDEEARPAEDKIAAKADTIAQLATALSMPEGALESTVAYYNEHAAKGQDPVYRKRTAYVKPIAQGPFYAMPVMDKAGTFTWGGLKINTDAQVINAYTQAPIAGLFSAGRNANDIFATYYQGSGTAVASAYTFGRIAGKKASSEERWASETS